MFLGRGWPWPGRFTAYRNGLAVVDRGPVGCRLLRARPRASWPTGPGLVPRPQVKLAHTTGCKGSSGVKSWSLLVILVGQGRQSQVVERLKEISCFLVQIIARQFEVHTAQKLRRGLQLYSVYSRMWGEEAARTMLANFRRILVFRGRHILLSAVCFSKFDWDKEKISDESLHRAASDLDSVGDLCKATVECEVCGKREVIDQQMTGVDYCMCNGSLGYTNESRVYDSWEPFIEREHHIVWRQRHHVHKHLFAYKVYGTYDDVSLNAFMEVQLNSNFRTEWDDTALELRVLDSDHGSNSELVYWLVKFPHFFANRDYIFKRRFIVNEGKKEVVIMSEAVSPDYIPEEKGIYRVSEYWSTMVIKAREDVNKPGLEYTLTYFDNPGTSLPQRLTNFIAATGFPGYLRKIHTAALSLQAIHEQGRDAYVSLPKELKHPKPKSKELLFEEPVEPITVGEELEVPVGLSKEMKRHPLPENEELMFEELTESAIPIVEELEVPVGLLKELKRHPMPEIEELMFEELKESAIPAVEELEVPVGLQKELNKHSGPENEELAFEELTEPAIPVEEVEVSLPAINSSQFRASDSTQKSELPYNEISFEKEPHVAKESDLKPVTEIIEAVEYEETTKDSAKVRYIEEGLFKTQEIPQHTGESDMLREDSKKLSLEVVITSEDKDKHSEFSHNDQCVQSDMHTISDSDEIKERTLPSQDTALHVHLGNKNFEVDLLEAMEIVAPDLERKTLLLKKIEKFKTSSFNSEKQNMIREKLTRLKNKIKSFQEHASQKRKSSLRKMEELAKRSHYDHSFVDEKTLKHLEMLFQAMSDVLQADKDFRTGKSFLNVFVDHCENDFPALGKEKSTSGNSSESSSFSQQFDNSEYVMTDGKYSASPSDEQELQVTASRKEPKQNETDKDSKPPGDSPPPASGKLSPETPESLAKGIDDEKTTNSEIEAYSCMECENDILENSSSVFSQWSSWIFVQYISTLWDSSNVYSSVRSVNMDDKDGLIPNGHKVHNEYSTKPFIAQIWYIIGLHWIFCAEAELSDKNHIKQEREKHLKDNENTVGKIICDNDSNTSSNWYWYPINGLYYAYAWAFSAPKENAQSAQL